MQNLNSIHNKIVHFILQEDFKKKPKLATLLATLSNYDVTIPPSKGKDGKTKAAKHQVHVMCYYLWSGPIKYFCLKNYQNLIAWLMFNFLFWQEDQSPNGFPRYS